MKKLFTLFAFLACFMGANAVEIVDAEVDFTTAESIKYYGWGRSDAAAERLSLDGENGLWYHSDEATGVNWDVQFFPIGGFIAEEGVTYTLHVTIKGSPPLLLLPTCVVLIITVQLVSLRNGEISQ